MAGEMTVLGELPDLLLCIARGFVLRFFKSLSTFRGDNPSNAASAEGLAGITCSQAEIKTRVPEGL